MTLSTDYLTLAQTITAQIPLPAVSGLYFPRPDQTGFRDEFGFVLLDSGDIGPFYVSLEDTLPELWRHYPQPQHHPPTLNDLLEKLTAGELAERALGFGAFNALSQHVLRRSGYQPVKRQHNTNTNTNTNVHAHNVIGHTLGMVGYFAPLVGRLVAQGRSVTVLEKHPERVAPHPLVRVVTEAGQLNGCDEVLCTASTLINDTLEGILAACPQVGSFHLIGPTAAGLPDVLFARGVDSIGAIRFADQALLQGILEREESWGSSGSKYEISRADYPGVTALLQPLNPVRG